MSVGYIATEACGCVTGAIVQMPGVSKRVINQEITRWVRGGRTVQRVEVGAAHPVSVVRCVHVHASEVRAVRAGEGESE